MRFYNLDGVEEDVQDPTFFINKELYHDTKETLDEMLSTYADLPMAQ